MKKLKVAVTGGIGSGKSSLCNVFKNHGYAILSSDLTAKEIMIHNAEVKKQIIKCFGKESYISDKLNIQHLSKEVFSNPEKTIQINSIVHPATIREIQKQIEKEFEKKDIVFVESALIYEAKIHKNFDFVILVYSDDNEKITRVTKRDNVNPDSVIARINNQIPDEKKKTRADFIINNNSTLDELVKRGEFILKIIENISKGE
jgi:dephospho-CoA kinase